MIAGLGWSYRVYLALRARLLAELGPVHLDQIEIPPISTN